MLQNQLTLMVALKGKKKNCNHQLHVTNESR